MSKTIAAIATGNSVSGIGVIRISGDSAIEIAQKVFKSADNTPLSSLKGYTAKFGNVYIMQNREKRKLSRDRFHQGK